VRAFVVWRWWIASVSAWWTTFGKGDGERKKDEAGRWFFENARWLCVLADAAKIVRRGMFLFFGLCIVWCFNKEVY